MKLRAITMKDVRRFTDPMRVEGIDDGVNVLSAPNEFGKSTLFDALRALFFTPHGSRGKEIAQLRPHAGGSPEVSVDIETQDGVFRISKRWFGKPEARVTRAGALVAQADEAEAWITRLLGGGDGGPSGLLWVRQGLTSRADGSGKEQQAALDARRDLLSSVTGEVEAMTGGRRMDAALARCREELGAYATATGRPSKGGAWAAAAQEAEVLAAERDSFAGRVRTLQAALAERTLLRRELAEIEAPEAVAGRRSRLETAAAAHLSAQAHAKEVAAAETALQAATVTADRARDDLAVLRRATKDHASAMQKDAEAEAQLEAALGALKAAETAFASAVAAHGAAEEARQHADRLMKKAQAQAAAASAKERRTELEDRVAKALAARQAVESENAAASSGPNDAAMDRLRALAAALTTARAEGQHGDAHQHALRRRAGGRRYCWGGSARS